MAAPHGNKNAVGNSGGYGYDKEYRKKQGDVKKKVLDEILRVLNGKNRKEKLSLVMKLGINCIPKEVEGTGDGGEFVIKIIDYGNGSGNPAQLRPGAAAVPAEGASEPGEVQVPEDPS